MKSRLRRVRQLSVTGVRRWPHPCPFSPYRRAFAFRLRSSASMAEKVALDKAWAEAARRCRLSPADVRMAKELGFKPRSLLKNQPSPQQPWKAPAAEWVRDLYAKRQRRSEQRRQRRERAQESMADLTNTDPSAATPTMPADI
jgi:hypothetical protein